MDQIPNQKLSAKAPNAQASRKVNKMTNECKEWFFTFGNQHKGTDGSVELNDRFVKIVGTHDEARGKMLNARGRLWQGQLEITDLPKAIEIWYLTNEISLDEVRLLPTEGGK